MAVLERVWLAAALGVALSSAWVILAGAAALFAGRRSPALGNLAWRAALAGLAAALAAPVAAALLPAGTLPSLAGPAWDTWLSPGGAVPLSLPGPAPLPAGPAPAPLPAPDGPLPWAALLGAAWLLLAAGRAAALGVEAARWRRVCRHAHPAPPEVDELAARLAGRVGCRRRVRVAVTGAVPVPVAVGVRRPRILLPAPSSREALRPVLAHELAHVARGDLGWLLFLRALQALLFWHPLLPLAGRGLCASAEAACDALAVEALGDSVGYGKALVAWAERARPVPAAALPFPPAGSLRARVAAVLSGPCAGPLRPSRRHSTGAAGAVLSVALLAASLAPPAAPSRLSAAPASGPGEARMLPPRMAQRQVPPPGTVRGRALPAPTDPPAAPAARRDAGGPQSRPAPAGHSMEGRTTMKKALTLYALAVAAPLAAAPAVPSPNPALAVNPAGALVTEPAPAAQPVTSFGPVVEPLYAPGGKIPQPRPFADVPKSHWAYDAVEYLRQLGLIEGYPGDPPTFNAPEAKPAKRHGK